ncbi:general transcription factor II-I repeat domain-containing protein 2A [Trichonephila clavipes]|nr:general transcription factor II-I repeat domain-containing protein 2A [Trichonephila clavipes]
MFLYLETIKDRILKLAENVTDQQKKDINFAPFISLCLDESIDITKSARLAVFARYCVGNIIKEELIAITSLLTTTKGTNICTAVRNSLVEKEIDLKKIVSVTTDGAPNMRMHGSILEKVKKNTSCPACQYFEIKTATAGSDVVQSGRPIFDDFFQHLWPYIGNNTANVVFQMVKRLWLIRIDQRLYRASQKIV